MRLKGKVALVLGAIKGIGQRIGLALGNDGARVALTYFDWEESLNAMQTAFAENGCDHLILRTNLRQAEEVEKLIQDVIHHFGRLDILINNIERGGWPVVHGPYVPGQWDLEMETTLRAKWWVFNSAWPYLKKSGEGAVINLSSISGIVGRNGPASYVFNDGYAAANRAISSFTESWARLGAPHIRVNEIMLGFMESRHGENTRGWDLLTQAQKKAIVDHTLLKRIGRIDDVVKAVRFILMDAPFMTGAVLKLDGGYCLGGETVMPMPPGVLNE
jgi:3-oxoacyl-[acyl-carrier protein] reductase